MMKGKLPLFLIGWILFAPSLWAKTQPKNAEYITAKDSALEFVLEASTDLEGEEPRFEILQGPEHGGLEGEAPNLTYTPEEGYQGEDQITFRALDSSEEGEQGLIKIMVGKIVHLPKLTEAHIALRITKTKGKGFFRIMVDEEERPYLEIESTMREALDMIPSCDIEDLSCEAKLHQKNQTYYIDGEDLEFWEEGGDEKELPEGIFLLHENKFWLRFDYWEKWLPVKVTWDLEAYLLDLNPKYTLLAQLQSDRKQNWERLLKDQKDDGEEKEPPIKAPWDFRYEGRYNAQASTETQTEGTKTNIAGLSYDVNLDLYGGTFLITGSYQDIKVTEPPPSEDATGDTTTDATTDATTDTGELDPHQIRWHYTLKDTPYFKLLEAGDFLAPGTVLFPHVIATKGFRIKKLEDVKRTQDSMMVHGQGMPGSEVALFRSGYLIGYTTVASDGSYTFDQLMVAGGEQLRLRFYYPDGSTKEEVYQVASDNGSIIPVDQWDAQYFTGENDEGRLHQLQFAWGLKKNLTLGANLYAFPETIPSSSLVMASLAYRPFWGLLLQADLGSHENGQDMGLQADLTWLEPNLFKITYKQYGDESPSRFYENSEEQSSKLTKLQHSLSLWSWNWQAELIQKDVSDEQRFTLRKHISPTWSAYGQVEIQKYDEGEDSQVNSFVADYISGRHSVQVKTEASAGVQAYSATYRFMGHDEFPFDTHLEFGKNLEEEDYFAASIRWRPTENVKTDASTSTDSNSASAGYYGIFASDPGPTKYEDFGKGTVTGHVFYPYSNEAFLEWEASNAIIAEKRQALIDAKIAKAEAEEKAREEAEAAKEAAEEAEAEKEEQGENQGGIKINLKTEITTSTESQSESDAADPEKGAETEQAGSKIAEPEQTEAKDQLEEAKPEEDTSKDQVKSDPSLTGQAKADLSLATQDGLAQASSTQTQNGPAPAEGPKEEPDPTKLTPEEEASLPFLPDFRAPMAGVVVLVNRYKGITDEEGRFVITGLPVEQELDLELDNGSLDVGMASQKEKVSLYFRPGSLIGYDPRIVHTVGIDGKVVKRDGEILPETKLKLIAIPEGKILQEVEVEPDGFFVIENVMPGTYQLEVTGVDDPPEPMRLNVEDGSVWIPELRFEW